MLKLFNTLGRKKQNFRPIYKDHVGIYSCGPTVYWYQHIGNLRSYLFADILKRTLQFNNFKVKHIINITDVGHLTSDADSGEDKIEVAAAKEHKTAHEIADHYFKVFENDLNKLNIIPPTKWTKATDHIKEQLELIHKLDKKGYTYLTQDGIYFDTSKFKNYSQLARKKDIKEIEKKEIVTRIDLQEKKQPTDFALWKFSQNIGQRQQEWNPKDYGYNFPIGYPGWHIECSAMSMKYLGNSFDIHTGGNDHIPVHHTNEIAQSQASTGKKFVKYWIHGAFLTFKGEKVSKSKGGLYTLSELEKEGFKPLTYRYFCLLAHYRSELDFSLENLDAAQTAYNRLKNQCENLIENKNEEVNKKYISQFLKAINDDLNMPKAIQVLWSLLKDKKAHGKYQTIKEMDKVFGLNLLNKDELLIPKEIQDLVNQREIARKNKDYKLSDLLRDKINSLGFTVSDTPSGQVISKKE